MPFHIYKLFQPIFSIKSTITIKNYSLLKHTQLPTYINRVDETGKRSGRLKEDKGGTSTNNRRNILAIIKP